MSRVVVICFTASTGRAREVLGYAPRYSSLDAQWSRPGAP